MDNRLIEASYKIDFREKKVLLAMINQVIRRGDQEEYILRAPEAAEITGLDKKDLYRNIKTIANNLREKFIFWYENDEQEEFDMLFPFNRLTYKKSVFTFQLNQDFKELILKYKEGYTKYFLRNIKPMKSVYSIRLYELLKQYQEVGAQSRCFEIPQLQEILQCSYSVFSNFRIKVIEKAVEEINAYSDLSISYYCEKKTRSYFWITFSISKNHKNIEILNSPDQEEIEQIPYMKTLGIEFVSRGVIWPVFKGMIKKNNIDWMHVWYFWNEVLKRYLKDKSPKHQTSIIVSTFNLDGEKDSEMREQFVAMMGSYQFRDMSHIPES